MTTELNTNSKAIIIGMTDTGERIPAASGRISTQPGTALEILELSKDAQKNANLISKVTRSGHTSTVEHTVFNIAFQNVSVLVEQFVIEFRLASFTVKSRRYVDFAKLGYYVPHFESKAIQDKYLAHMNYLYKEYEAFIDAGITKDGLMMRMSEAQWDAVINVNLKSAFNFIHAVTPIMAKQRSGSIINMSSVVGVSGNAGQCNYSASKAGMIGLAKSIAKEMGPRGIRANCIAPGFIITDMTNQLSQEIKDQWAQQIPMRRGGTPEDVANVALFLASDLSSYVSGQTIHCCGAMNS